MGVVASERESGKNEGGNRQVSARCISNTASQKKY